MKALIFGRTGNLSALETTNYRQKAHQRLKVQQIGTKDF